MSAGPGEFMRWPIVVGDGSQSQQVTLVATDAGGQKLVDFALSAKVTPQAVMNAIAGAKPGSTGFVRLTFNSDVGRLGLSRTLTRQEGRELRSAQVAARLSADYSPTDAKLSGGFDLTKVKTYDVAQGREIPIQDILLTAAGTLVGTAPVAGQGVTASAADFRDLSLDVTARGVEGHFKGQSIASLQGKLVVVLEQMQADLGQIVPFNGWRLAGRLNVDVLATTGRDRRRRGDRAAGFDRRVHRDRQRFDRPAGGRGAARGGGRRRRRGATTQPAYATVLSQGSFALDGTTSYRFRPVGDDDQRAEPRGQAHRLAPRRGRAARTARRPA